MGLHLYYTYTDSLDMETFAFTFTVYLPTTFYYKNKMLLVSTLRDHLHAGNL